MNLYAVLSGLLLALYFKNLKQLFETVDPWVFYGIYSLAMLPRSFFCKTSSFKISFDNWKLIMFLIVICYVMLFIESNILKNSSASSYVAVRYGVLIFTLSLFEPTLKSSIGALLIVLGIFLV